MTNKVKHTALAALIAAVLGVPVVTQALPEDAAVQLLQRVNQLEAELSNLRGENEKLRNDLEEVQKNQKDGFLQVDERMEKLEDTPATNEPASSETKPDEGDENAAAGPEAKVEEKPDATAPADENKPAADTDKNKAAPPRVDNKDPNSFYSYGTGVSDDPNKDMEKPAADGGDSASTAADAPAKDEQAGEDKAAPKLDERASYDEAFNTLLKEPKDAIPMFRAFMQEYPSSSLAPSAQYWVGEANYAEKNFQEAAREFLVVLKDYKNSDKAPDAAVKLGYSFYEMKDWDKARRTLADVKRFFPDTDAAKLADERLAQMQTEGH